MLLLNFDFYDIHSALTMLRAKPEKEYNIEIVKALLEVLSTPQADNKIDNNIIRKKLRTIETLDKEDFRWVYVDNIYTYGWIIIKDEKCYSFLAKGFQMVLEYAVSGDFQRLADLADALHDIPIFIADGCKNFKKTVKIQFSRYNKTYSTDLLKELSK
jgi:hypothetical protein